MGLEKQDKLMAHKKKQAKKQDNLDELKPGQMTMKIQLIMGKPDAELEESDLEELMNYASKRMQKKKGGK